MAENIAQKLNTLFTSYKKAQTQQSCCEIIWLVYFSVEFIRGADQKLRLLKKTVHKNSLANGERPQVDTNFIAALGKLCAGVIQLDRTLPKLPQSQQQVQVGGR